METFDNKKLAYCGLYCEQCSFKAAHDENDDVHLKSLPFQFEIKDVSVYDCGGCKADNCICGNCKIKPCAVDKQIESCANCKDFPCTFTNNFENDGMPHHKTAIENLRYIKENGIEKWFENIKPQLKCEKCGKKQSWYYKCKH